MQRLSIRIAAASMAVVTACVPVIASATAYTIDDVGSSVGLGTSDLKTSVVNIISWVLGIMALIAVALIIFAGFIAATSQGEERGEKAKQVIVAAVIGLVIILISWAIVVFVIGSAKNVIA